MLRILAILGWVLLSGFSANPAFARTAHIKVQRIHTPVVMLDGVDMQVQWPADARQGRLDMRVARLQAPSIAGDYKSVRWQCALSRTAWKTWRCDGPISMPGTPAARFSMEIAPEGLQLDMKQGDHVIALQRRTNAPELTLITLQALPVAWARAFIKQAWPDGTIEKGALDGRLALRTGSARGIEVTGPLRLSKAALRTRDDGLIAENVDVSGTLDYSNHQGATAISLRGTVLGDMLAGTTFVSIQGQPARFDIVADSTARGWNVKRVHWADGQTLTADGSLAWTRNGMEDVAIDFDSQDASLLKDRYLSGWLAPVGLSEVQFGGGVAGRVSNVGGGPLSYAISPRAFNLTRPDGQLRVSGLNGGVVLSQGSAVESHLQWHDAKLYGLDFGAGDFPLVSEGGTLALRAPAAIPVFNGLLRFNALRIRPPRGEAGLGLDFALAVEDVDFGALSEAVGLPAYRGRLNGNIPKAVYEDEVLKLDGGLALDLFDGHVAFSSLSIERPFGTAPTLVTDLAIDRLDLLRLTEVLGFGSITGRLSGGIRDMRLIGWSPVRFDAELHTVRVPGVKQRISQRAVKNISSVGGAGPTGGLQAMALNLFKDFGYSQIGLRCRLVNSICMMSGLEGETTSGSGPDSFTILKGAGIPRLTVIGHNRQVDWPVLVERLKAVAAGDVKPVIEH